MAFQSLFKHKIVWKLDIWATSVVLNVAPTVTAGRLLFSKGTLNELVSFSSVSGTTVSWLVRQLSTTANPATSTGDWYFRWDGTQVELVAMHDQIPDTKGNNTFSGTQTFTNATVTTNLSIPRFADTTARNTAIPSPTGKELVITNNILQTYNTATTQREDKDTGTPPPQASTTAQGIIEIATEAEATTGTDTERAMTPATTKAVVDASIGAIDKWALYETGLIAGESITENDLIRKWVSWWSESTSKRYKASASTIAWLPTDYPRIATSSAVLDWTFSAVFAWLKDWFTGLTANTVYYASNTAWLISATPWTIAYVVGSANSNSEFIVWKNREIVLSNNVLYTTTITTNTTNSYLPQANWVVEITFSSSAFWWTWWSFAYDLTQWTRSLWSWTNNASSSLSFSIIVYIKAWTNLSITTSSVDPSFNTVTMTVYWIVQ